MEVDNEMVDGEYDGDEVHNVKDLELLEQLQLGITDDDDNPPLEHEPDYDMRDSDDEDYDPIFPDHNDYF